MPGTSASGNRTGLPRAPGGGRKPKHPRGHWLTGDAGKRGLALVDSPADAGQIERTPAEISAAGEVPAMLNESERAYWELWAPIALSRGTLTPETRPGFVLLCQLSADVAEVRGDIRARGILFEKVDNVGGEEVRELKKHPLWPEYRGLRQQQKELLSRYGLAALGMVGNPRKPKKDDEREELQRLRNIR